MGLYTHTHTHTHIISIQNYGKHNETSIKDNNKGITLVALIITIIILVILAAVTIRSVMGFGLIDLATRAAENYAFAQGSEKSEIKKTEDLIEDARKKIEKELLAPGIEISRRAE